MLRNLPDVFRRVAVVHAKSEHESHPRSPLVLAKGGVVQGGGDPAVLFCLVEVVVESRVQVAKHLRICVNVLLGRLDGVYRRFRPFGVQAGESIHGGGVSGERWRVRGKCQSRCFSRFRKLLLMKPHTRGDVLKRTAQRQRPVHSARPANDLDPRP